MIDGEEVFYNFEVNGRIVILFDCFEKRAEKDITRKIELAIGHDIGSGQDTDGKVVIPQFEISSCKNLISNRAYSYRDR